jgi:hypothetical protein
MLVGDSLAHAAPGATDVCAETDPSQSRLTAEREGPSAGRAPDPTAAWSIEVGPPPGAWIASWVAARGFIVATDQQADPQTTTACAAVPDIWPCPTEPSWALPALM